MGTSSPLDQLTRPFDFGMQRQDSSSTYSKGILNRFAVYYGHLMDLLLPQALMTPPFDSGIPVQDSIEELLRVTQKKYTASRFPQMAVS
jgi:hypothetical protein